MDYKSYRMCAASFTAKHIDERTDLSLANEQQGFIPLEAIWIWIRLQKRVMKAGTCSCARLLDGSILRKVAPFKNYAPYLIIVIAIRTSFLLHCPYTQLECKSTGYRM